MSPVVETQRLRQLYRSLPIGVLVHATLAVLVAMMLEPMVASSIRYFWLALLATVLSARALLAGWWMLAQREPARVEADGEAWLIRFRFAAFATGTAWGIGSIAMFPAGDVTYQIFLALVLAGISAGAVTTMAPDAISALGMMLPTTLPGIARLFVEGGQIPWMMSAMGLVFVLYLLASVLRANAGYAEILRLRAEATARETALLERTESLRVATDAAESANRAKSEFLSSMSHELRTPLNAVLGYSELLGTDPHLPAEARDNALEIHRAGEHLLALVDGVIDLARIESGDLPLSLQPLPARIVAREATDMLRPLAEKRNVELRNHIGQENGTRVVADYQRLRQVLINLLSNAIKYNRSGGSVTLACLAQSGKVRITVADTGYGIAPNKRVRVFTPFDRLGEERGAIEGTGIGLSICKRMVEAMGGQVGFDSTPGEGTTFWVDLPAPEFERLDVC